MQLLTAALWVMPLFEFMLIITLLFQVQAPLFELHLIPSIMNIFYWSHSLFLTARKENASCVISKSEATFVPDEE